MKLKTDLESITEAQRDVQDRTEGQDAIPRYQEATSKIKQANDQLKTTLEDVQKWCKDTNSLAVVLSNKDSDFATKTRKQLEEMDKLLATLASSAGSLPLRMEVVVGELDRRLRLPQCGRPPSASRCSILRYSLLNSGL